MAIQATTQFASGETSGASFRQTEPSAGRIAHAIAAFPYSPLVATMDIVDNAVESGASGVSVSFETEDKAITRIVIGDNGSGISDKIIDEVLRAGSRTSHLYSSTSLSRFGVGLKGAGFALATKITVLTRNGAGQIVRRSIDQMRIEATDRWDQEVRNPTPSECKFFEDTLAALPGGGNSKTGTVVVLEGVKVKTRDLSKLRADVVRSAGETYCKFLASADGEIRRLSIIIDDAAVEPVDPLHRENPGTQLFYKRERVEFDDGSSAFFTAAALPHPNTQPDELARRYRYQQKYQGAYVYRNGRLVRSGETFGLFSRDFHLNAYRVEIEFDSTADAHFNVDVAKSTIVLDDDAEAKLKRLFTDSARMADTLWRQRDVLTKADIEDLFNESNRLIGSRANLLVNAINQKRNELLVRKPGKTPQVDVSRPPPAAPRAISVAPPAAKPGGLPRPGAVVTVPKKPKAAGYLRPVDHLPDGMLYRPFLDAEIGLIVEVNVSHAFAKAVFEGEAENAKRSVPRRATTAIQQLLYVLGHCEFNMSDDEDGKNAELFEQYRRYLSMNLSALLG